MPAQMSRFADFSGQKAQISGDNPALDVVVDLSLGIVFHQVSNLQGIAGELAAGNLDGPVAATLNVESGFFDDVTGELLFGLEEQVSILVHISERLLTFDQQGSL